MEKCPDCGVPMDQIDKNTFTGEVWRDYLCPKCKKVFSVNEGTALWKALSDAREEDEKKKP